MEWYLMRNRPSRLGAAIWGVQSVAISMIAASKVTATSVFTETPKANDN